MPKILKNKIKFKNRMGFSLLEMIVAMFVFSLAMVAATSIFSKFIVFQKKAKVIQQNVEDSRFAMELMAKTLRTSSIISCNGDTACLESPNPPSSVEFYNYSQGKCMRYYFDSSTNKIKSTTALAEKDMCNLSELTANGTDTDMINNFIKSLTFSVLQTDAVTPQAGKVTMLAEVCSTQGCSGVNNEKTILQTSVSLRDYSAGAGSGGGGGTCGNGICDDTSGGETCSNCPGDCGVCPPSNFDPAVNFTNPSSGATLSGTIVVNARAYDPDTGSTADGAGIANVVFTLVDSGGTTVASQTENVVTYDWTLDTTAYPNGNYTLRATATSTPAEGGTSSVASIPVTVNNLSAGEGTILREWWYGISGDLVSSLTSNASYPNSPTGSEFITSFEGPTDAADNYGSRIYGYLHPPTTGSYTFWIASDDNSELWLSTNDNPSNAVKIAYVDDWTNSREWTKYPTIQQSPSIALQGGQRYYIMALQKDGTGGDNVAVAWQGPGISQQVIPGSYLSPASPGGGTTAPTVSITAPANGATVSGTVAVNARANDPDVGGADGDGIANVVFELVNSGGTTVASIQENILTYDWNLDTTLYPDGNYTLKATATSTPAAGGTSSVASVPVTISNAAATLIGHWKLDEVSGTNANDSSSSGLDGTLSGPPAWTAGLLSGALNFDGINDYVYLSSYSPYNVDPGEKRTFSAWFKAGAQPTTNYILWNEGSCRGWYASLNNTGQFQWSFSTSPSSCSGPMGYRITTSGYNYADNQWHLFTGVIDRPNNQMELFMDGVSQGTAAIDNIDPAAGGYLKFGTKWDNTVFFAGTIDDVRAYDGVLSAAEIQALYTAGGVDTTDPTVSMTAPSNGATVSGSSVAVSANASDNVGVAGVQFKLGGADLGTEDTTSPYSINWDTTGVSNGSYDLTAVARDAAGNQTTATAVNVTVNNAVACSPQIVDQQATNSSGNSTFVNDQERGESFTAGVSGKLYSITLRRHTSGSAVNLHFKVGSSTNLGTNTQFNCSVPTGIGEFECVIPDADQPTLVAGNTYHFLFRAADNTQPSWVFSRDGVNTNYSGMPYFDSTKDWLATNGTMDLYFKTKMCVSDIIGHWKLDDGLGTERIPNGNFNTDTVGWQKTGVSTLAWQNAVSGNGSTGYMRFNIASNADYDRFATNNGVNITSPSTAYQVSFWYRTSGITGNLQAYSGSSLSTLGTTASWASSQITPSTSWRFYSTTLTTDAADYPMFGISKLGAIGTGTFDIDAISVKTTSSSTTTAIDSSVSNHDGTLINGPTWTAGPVAGGLNLDGTDDYVNLGAFNFGNITSISMWANINSSESNIQTLISNSPSGNAANGFKLFVNTYGTSDRKVIIETGNGSLGNAASSAIDVFSYPAWHHIVAILDRTSGLANVYLDGVQVITNDGIRNDFGTNQTTHIGQMTNNAYRFGGKLDDIRVYNYAISPAEIQALYSSGTP